LFFPLVAALKILADALHRLRFLPCYKRKYLRPNSPKPLRSGYKRTLQKTAWRFSYLPAFRKQYTHSQEIKTDARVAFHPPAK
jgi:hypothetical protein